MWKVRLDTNKGKVRSVNQDCWVNETFSILGKHSILCGVADGMGGHLSGDVASRIAVSELATSVREQSGGQSPREILSEAFRAANHKVYGESIAHEECAGMGTTLTAAIIVEDELTLGHVGDSRAYILSPQGLTRVTNDHSLVEELIRQGGLTPDDAEKHPQRHMLTKALGTEAEIEADFATIDLAKVRQILFCTDGLTRLVTDKELEAVLLTPRGDLDAVSKLMDLALERGAPDNVTVVLVSREGGAN